MGDLTSSIVGRAGRVLLAGLGFTLCFAVSARGGWSATDGELARRDFGAATYYPAVAIRAGENPWESLNSLIRRA